MELRKNSKSTIIKGRTFHIKKFDPMFGFWLTTTVLGDLVGKKNKLDAMIQSLTKKPREEFMELQKEVLKYCYEELPVGPTRVLDENGNYSVELTAPIIMSLFVQTILFSITDFFDQEVMEGIVKEVTSLLKNLTPSPEKN